MASNPNHDREGAGVIELVKPLPDGRGSDQDTLPNAESLHER